MDWFLSIFAGMALGYSLARRKGEMLSIRRPPWPTQSARCYCPSCRNELCGDTFTKIYDAGSEVHFICGTCNLQSDWLFDSPVPILLRTLSAGSRPSETAWGEWVN